MGSAFAELEADHHDTSHSSGYCCTANVAMSNTFMVCENIMTQFSDPEDQEYYCFNGRKTGTSGYFGHVDTCKYVPCSEVGYCIGKKDEQYYDDLLAWEAEVADIQAEEDGDLEEDMHHRTPRTRAPKPSRAPRPTRAPKTPRPTKLKTPRPSRAPRTPRPTFYMTARPTVDRTGVTYGDRPLPLTGCAEIMEHVDCYADNECVWKFGYPPLAMAEDEEYMELAVDAYVYKMCLDKQKAKTLEGNDTAAVAYGSVN